MMWSLIFHVLALCGTLVASDPLILSGQAIRHRSNAPPLQPRADAGAERIIAVPVMIDPANRVLDPTTGRTLLPATINLQASSSATEAEVDLKAGFRLSQSMRQTVMWQFLEGKPKPEDPALSRPGPNAPDPDVAEQLGDRGRVERYRYIIGTTTMSNDDLFKVFDKATREVGNYKQGMSDSKTMVTKVLRELNLPVPSELQKLMDLDGAFWEVNSDSAFQAKTPPIARDIYTITSETDLRIDAIRTRTEWPGDRSSPTGPTQQSKIFRKTSTLNLAPFRAPAPPVIDPSNTLRGKKSNIFACFGWKRSVSTGGACDASLPDEKAPADVKVYTTKPQTSLVFARVNRVLATLPVILGEIGAVAGATGLALAPLFIILDFIQGKPVAAALGAVGMAIGEWGILLAEGAVAIAAVTLVAALFFIIPALWDSGKVTNYPSNLNTTEVIQFAFFGDASHTGNEKCREGSDGKPGNPNCTALYGPGVLGSTFGWNNYDSIAFMLGANNGHPMAISDLAAAFHLVNDTTPNGGADLAATITCKPPPYVCNRFNCPGPQRHKCGKPTFKLNLSLITIPGLNQTADKIFDRIIPKPGGDCKLINDVSGINIAEYNLTVTGAPVAIACNLTSSLNIEGHAVPINDPNASKVLPPALVSPGNASTDGLSHQVAAPNATGFPPILNVNNAACIDGDGGSICLPNGTYAPQMGSQGFISSRAKSLQIPPGAALTLSVPETNGGRGAVTKVVQHSYTTNQTANNAAFHKDMGTIGAVILGSKSFDVIIPANIRPPPVVCLFTETHYLGDVSCYGPGSGNVTMQASKAAQSLKVQGGAAAWIYGQFYGDDGGQQVTESVPDLATVFLGADDNLSKKIVAMWITAPRS